MLNLKVKQLSSLEKIKNEDELINKEHIASATVFQGEHFAYQFVISSKSKYIASCEIESPINDCVTPYIVLDAVVDYPAPDTADDDYLMKTQGTMPDILEPLSKRENIIPLKDITSIWVDINVPKDLNPGVYPVTVKVKNISFNEWENFEFSQIMRITVLEKNIRKQEIMVTQWFHIDCIASVHNVEIYSEKHWNLIDKYVQMAVDNGINMFLTPVLTPHLDIDFGVDRPNVQLVDIDLYESGYKFDFTKLKRWISICKKNKVKYYEISHLFSQWGLKCTPNVMVKENGKEVNLFGWHVEGKSEEYADFLIALLPELMKVLKEEGIKDNTYFHISDEPSVNDIDRYKYAYELIKPLIGDCKIIEACSDTKFYDDGLLDIPVACTNYIEKFIDSDIKELFAYYCCTGANMVGNRFIAMPAYRNRVLGIQLYKYSIDGFLQWGYNFYYNGHSNYKINPYVTTSADRHHPSGDPFSVYPGDDGPVASTRLKVFKDALQDIQVCKMLEKHIGKDRVIKLIEDEAGMEITFRQYPRNNEFYCKLSEKLKETIKEYIN